MISWFEKHPKISLIIVILIAIGIFYMSSKSFKGGTPGPDFPWKPVAYHLVAFFFLAFFLLIFLLKGEVNNKTRFLMLLGIFIAMSYGISDEIHQLFVPGRHGSFVDILIDSVGILFASLLYSFNLKFKKK